MGLSEQLESQLDYLAGYAIDDGDKPNRQRLLYDDLRLTAFACPLRPAEVNTDGTIATSGSTAA